MPRSILEDSTVTKPSLNSSKLTWWGQEKPLRLLEGGLCQCVIRSLTSPEPFLGGEAVEKPLESTDRTCVYLCVSLCAHMHWGGGGTQSGENTHCSGIRVLGAFEKNLMLKTLTSYCLGPVCLASSYPNPTILLLSGSPMGIPTVTTL